MFSPRPRSRSCSAWRSPPLEGRQLPLQPLQATRARASTAAFEGWYQNADGSYNLLLGYFNRNQKQTLDIPVGPNNRIEPGGPDYGQPTHFQLRRGWGVFAIKVPKDFGDKRYTWTIIANGQTTSLPVGVIKDYQIEPFKEAARGQRAAEDEVLAHGPDLHRAAGRHRAQAHRRGRPAGDARGRSPPTTCTKRMAQNPTSTSRSPRSGAVVAQVSRPRRRHVRGAAPEDRGPTARSTTTATFSAPGEYMLRAQANDDSGEGGGGFQCCWTNAYVKVTIK